MRNALNNLADSVKDPKEKQVCDGIVAEESEARE